MIGSDVAWDLLRVLLPETILAVAAVGILLGDVFRRKAEAVPSGTWVATAAVGAIVAAGVANGMLPAVSGAAVEAGIALDGFRTVANYVLLGATLLAVLFSLDYLHREEQHIGEFFVLLLLCLVGMMVLVAARDLILLFVGLELMSIAAYVLTGFDRRRPRAGEAGLKYFLIGAFASAFLLYGIALVYGAVGTTSLVGIAPRVSGAVGAGDPLLIAGVAFLLIGFGFKVSAVPFHMWTPDAYEGAPAPVTAFMAAGVKAAAVVALLRVVTVDLAPASPFWESGVWWLAMLTMIVPNLVALAQDNVKRMLAYSSVAHAGYLLVGVAAASPLGRGAALFYLAVYALMTVGAFAVVSAVAGKGEARLHLADYRGLGWRRPWLGLALTIFLLSLAGFPPTGGFVAKLFLLRSSLDAGQVALAVTLVLTSLVSYYYYFRVVWKMYFEEAPEEVPMASTGRAFRFATLLSAVGVTLLGVLPGPVLASLERVGEEVRPPLVSSTGAMTRVRGDSPPSSVGPDPTGIARRTGVRRLGMGWPGAGAGAVFPR